MGEHSRRVLAWAMATGMAIAAAAVALPSVAEEKPSVFRSMSDSIKRGFTSVSDAVTPKAKESPADDPTALSTKSKPSPDLHIAMARMQERTGNLDEAAKHYQQALAAAPQNVSAMSGLAHLKVMSGDLAGATSHYLHASHIAPNEPSVFNDLGLCYAQRKMLAEARASLQRAVQLQPTNALYRNNLAAVLVDAGQTDAALAQLKAVFPEAIAQYNLGYLLVKKGQPDEAAEHFSLALKLNPSLSQAGQWLQRLNHQPNASAGQPGEVMIRSGEPAARPVERVATEGPLPVIRSGTRIEQPTPPPTQSRFTASPRPNAFVQSAMPTPGETPQPQPMSQFRRLPPTNWEESSSRPSFPASRAASNDPATGALQR